MTVPTVTRVDHRRRRQFFAVAAGIVLILLLATMWAGVQVDERLRAARVDDAGRVLAAVTRGDCATAAAAYHGATTGRMLPGRRRPPVAEDVTRAATDCRDLSRVDAIAAAERQVEALRGYLEFRHTHLFSPLYGRVPDRIGKVLRSGRVVPDPATCRLVAESVRDPDKPPTSADTLPGLLTTCGEVLAQTGKKIDNDRWWALDLLSRVRQQYTGSPEARRAEAAQAALLLETPGNATPLPKPERVRAGSGQVRVRYWNHTDAIMTLVLSGPGGRRLIEVPACSDCSAPDDDDDGCAAGKGRAAILTLQPGTYEAWIGIAGREWSGTWRMSGGTYEDCFVESGG
jgi:hypothetical protein